MNTAFEQLLQPRLVLAVGLFWMHCAAWWLACVSLFVPPLEKLS